MEPDLLITPSLVKDKQLLNKFWIGSELENSDFLFIRFFRGITDATMCAIFNKKTNAITFLKDNMFKNDLGGGTGFWPKQIINDNMLVDHIDAFDLLKSIIPSDLRSSITETSNPVLMILR